MVFWVGYGSGSIFFNEAVKGTGSNHCYSSYMVAYFCPPTFFKNHILIWHILIHIQSTVKISSFPPFFYTSYPLYSRFYNKSSYFFPNHPITHIFYDKYTPLVVDELPCLRWYFINCRLWKTSRWQSTGLASRPGRSSTLGKKLSSPDY